MPKRKKSQEWMRPLPPLPDDTEAERILEQRFYEDDHETGLQSDDDCKSIPF